MNDVEECILELLAGPGTRTKASLVSELEGEVEQIEVTRALGNLVVEGEVEEHPEIDGAYRLTEFQ